MKNTGASYSPSLFSGFARVSDGTGFTIENPAQYGGISNQALATPGPVTIEAVVDPFKPPISSKVTLEQASEFALSLAHGEPNREQIAFTVLANKPRELVWQAVDNVLQVNPPCDEDSTVRIHEEDTDD